MLDNLGNKKRKFGRQKQVNHFLILFTKKNNSSFIFQKGGGAEESGWVKNDFTKKHTPLLFVLLCNLVFSIQKFTLAGGLDWNFLKTHSFDGKCFSNDLEAPRRQFLLFKSFQLRLLIKS